MNYLYALSGWLLRITLIMSVSWCLLHGTTASAASWDCLKNKSWSVPNYASAKSTGDELFEFEVGHSSQAKCLVDYLSVGGETSKGNVSIGVEVLEEAYAPNPAANPLAYRVKVTLKVTATWKQLKKVKAGLGGAPVKDPYAGDGMPTKEEVERYEYEMSKDNRYSTESVVVFAEEFTQTADCSRSILHHNNPDCKAIKLLSKGSNYNLVNEFKNNPTVWSTTQGGRQLALGRLYAQTNLNGSDFVEEAREVKWRKWSGNIENLAIHYPGDVNKDFYPHNVFLSIYHSAKYWQKRNQPQVSRGRNVAGAYGIQLISPTDGSVLSSSFKHVNILLRVPPSILANQQLHSELGSDYKGDNVNCCSVAYRPLLWEVDKSSGKRTPIAVRPKVLLAKAASFLDAGLAIPMSDLLTAYYDAVRVAQAELSGKPNTEVALLTTSGNRGFKLSVNDGNSGIWEIDLAIEPSKEELARKSMMRNVHRDAAGRVAPGAVETVRQPKSVPLDKRYTQAPARENSRGVTVDGPKEGPPRVAPARGNSVGVTVEGPKEGPPASGPRVRVTPPEEGPPRLKMGGGEEKRKIERLGSSPGLAGARSPASEASTRQTGVPLGSRSPATVLKVVALTLSPVQPDAGDRVNLTVKLKNAGQTETGAQDQVQLTCKAFSGHCPFKDGSYPVRRMIPSGGGYDMKIGAISTAESGRYEISVLPVGAPVSATQKLVVNISPQQGDSRSSPTILRSEPALRR